MADIEMRVWYAELISESQRGDTWWRNYVKLTEQRARLRLEIGINREADIRDIEGINVALQMYYSDTAAYEERRPGSNLPPRQRGFYAD